MPVNFSAHPRTKKRLDNLKDIKINNLIKFSKPFGFFEYINLQKNAKCVLSDSGTITEESSLLSFPAVTIRNTHERPEGMDEAALIMCGLKTQNVLDAVEIVTCQFAENPLSIKPIKDYDADNVSKKVVRIITSYTEYVNQNVWKK